MSVKTNIFPAAGAPEINSKITVFPVKLRVSCKFDILSPILNL